jgi:glycosyltransferase involved in cell wall biosynthesis
MNNVSLIIPTFNRPHLLPRAVESAQRAGREVEIIVVDDASSDDTARVCAGLPDIKYVRLERNQGVAGARNVGLLESTGEFVAFLDDDDLRLPGSLDHQVSLLAAHPEAGFVAGGVMLADQVCVPTGEVAVPRADGGDLFWRALELNLSPLLGSVVVRKTCFYEVGIFNRHLSGIDDWDMWTRIAELRPILIDERAVCIYRRPSPTSGQGSSALARQLHSAAKHQRRLLSLRRAQSEPEHRRRGVRKAMRRRVADTLSWRAAEELPRGAFRYAASNFLVALRLSPLWAARPTHLRVLWHSAAAQLRARREPRAPIN